MTLSLRARWLFPVDRPPIENGVVTFEGTRIVEVGENLIADKILELGSVALMPALVNAHTHLEFSYLRRPLGNLGMSLVDWIRLVISERGRGDRSPSAAVCRGYDESIRFGSITVGDISTSPANSDGDITSFMEVIGFSRARADSALNVVTTMINGAMETDNVARTAPGFHRPAQYGISPHAPYTVSPNLLTGLIAIAKKHNLPLAMHLAESREELQFLQESRGPFKELLEERSMWDAAAIAHGSRPLNYLRALAEAPRALVIHGNYLEEDELAFLGANRERMSLVYCPRTHAYFGHPPYPLPYALRAGVHVALGTDSRASSPNLDLLAEMRLVSGNFSIDPQAVLRMGTLSGAEALGRDAEVGSITPGKSANLVAVPLPDDFNGGPETALESVLLGEQSVSSVWGGKMGVPGVGASYR